MKRWCAVTRPYNASATSSREALRRGLVNSINTPGSVSPWITASKTARPLPYELFARTRQVPELRDGLRWHEAAPDQAMRQQIRHPGGVLGIALTARHVAHLSRVGQHQLQLALQHMPHRLPINARGLHRRVAAPAFGEPLGQRVQRSCRGAELPHLPLHLPAFGDPNTGDHRLLVHVESRAPAMQHFHGAPSVVEERNAGVEPPFLKL